MVELGGLSAPCAGSRAEHSLCHSKSRALTVKRPRSQLAFALLSKLVPPAPNPRNDQELNLQQKESRASKDCFALALSPSRNIPLSAITRQRGLAAAARLDRFVDVSAGELLTLTALCTPTNDTYSPRIEQLPQDRTVEVVRVEECILAANLPWVGAVGTRRRLRRPPAACSNRTTQGRKRGRVGGRGGGGRSSGGGGGGGGGYGCGGGGGGSGAFLSLSLARGG